MVRKLLSLMLILLVFALPASADVLWEPYDNQYYTSAGHKAFTYADSTYVVPEGMTANLYKSPKNGGLIKTLQAGTRIYIGPVTEVNGEPWGAGYAYGDFENEGWIRLNRLVEEYGHDAFVADHENELVSTDDVLTREDIDGDILTWTYPGSGINGRTVPADALGGGYNDGVMSFIYVYTDPDGGRWGYVGYYMGSCDWVWLDDPTNPEPPLRLQPQQNAAAIDTSPEEDPGGGMLVLLGAMVIVLVLGTTVVVLLLKKRSRSK